jgi:hypothetical protein
MSRAQMGNVVNTAQGQNATLNQNSNTSFNAAQNDVNSYANEVGAFKAANPYVTGGAAETAENQQLADVAAASGTSAGQALQGAAVRGGENPGAAIAATKDIQTGNERALTGQEAAATERRLAAGTGYGQTVLGATGDVSKMEDTIANQQGSLAAGALSTEERAAAMPSFLDELGQGMIQSGNSFAQGYGQGMGKNA